MFKPADMTLWQGRIDSEESTPSPRWHQVIIAAEEINPQGSIALLGFCCDEGVARNKGRRGAKDGPNAIRTALANQAFVLTQAVIDAGDVICDNEDLEKAQQELGQEIAELLNSNHFPVIMGGGHEMAWGSYNGIESYLKSNALNSANIGIINFDAHLDLRTSSSITSSGTPFRQISEHRENNKQTFHYCVIGMNPTANTAGLIAYAKEKNVLCINDIECTEANIPTINNSLKSFIENLDYLYITLCLDVFPASFAPGVSAPAALGIDPVVAIKLIHSIKHYANNAGVKILMADIAEMSPPYDRDNVTAKLAARLIHELCLPLD